MAGSKLLTLVAAAGIESLLLRRFVSTGALPESVSTSLVFASCVAINTALWLVYACVVYPYFLSPLRHLPGPKGGLPIVHNGLVQFERPPGHKYLKWVTEIPNDGLIYYRGVFGLDTLLITNAAALAEVTVTKAYCFEKPQNSKDLLRPVLGDGLVLVEGDVHKFQRKNISPSFSFRHIKDLYAMMWGKANSLTARLTDECPPGSSSFTLDLTEWTSKATLDMIGLAGLGRDFNSIYNSEDELARLYRSMTERAEGRMVFFALNLIFGPKILRYLPLPGISAMKDKILQLRSICRRFVAEKKEAMLKFGDDNFDILANLVKSNNFSDDELVDQMLTFLAAGHDTTSLAFAWTCYLLAKYPETQSRLRAEVSAVLPELRDSANVSSTLESLGLLNGVCNETLRLYPTIPMTNRDCTAPDTTVVGHPVPVGTRVVFSVYAINRSPHMWGADADAFRPERWIDGQTGRPNNHGGATSNYNLLTFLHGPRSCIGQNFARAELRCLVAAMVTSFEIEMADPTEEVVPTGTVALRPAKGMRLRLTKLRAAGEKS